MCSFTMAPFPGQSHSRNCWTTERNLQIVWQAVSPTLGPGPQLMHIATDGETYGHHHRHGEMALAYALDYIQTRKLARITNYGEFLELVPPKHEVQIYENTAWSCVHGIERWRSDCGCNSGRAGWNQAWREPLREALDWLRDQAAPLFESVGARYLKDPWAARDAYISVLLDPSPKTACALSSNISGPRWNRLA